MPGLVPGIHEFLTNIYDVDGRDKPGHDKVRCCCRSYEISTISASPAPASTISPACLPMSA